VSHVPIDIVIALTGFASAAAITPGPNNVMLLASGLNFGFRRTVPHILGVAFGFAVLLTLTGVGIGRVLQSYPVIYDGLRIASLLYMLWLAWRIATSGPAKKADEGTQGKPMTFLQSSLFQWINVSLIVIVAVFTAVTLPSICVWTYFGVALEKVLRHPTKVRIFNIVMAIVLVLSFLPVVADLLPGMSDIF
jgi:threonine/homoserine/homoserine lactone efflux protein